MDENVAASVEKADASPDNPAKVASKSFRRKYRKIMVTFDQKMRESNQLFREHVRVMDISRRLSEQNESVTLYLGVSLLIHPQSTTGTATRSQLGPSSRSSSTIRPATSRE